MWAGLPLLRPACAILFVLTQGYPCGWHPAGVFPSDANAIPSASPWVTVWWGLLLCPCPPSPCSLTHPALVLTAFTSTKSSCSLAFLGSQSLRVFAITTGTALQLNSTREGQSRTTHPASDFHWHTVAIHYGSGSVCPLVLIPAASKNNQKQPVCLMASQHNRR